MVTAVIRQAVKGSSFRLPLLLLPRQKREDMQVLYAYCRALDDTVDDAPDHEAALHQLAFWEGETAAICGDGIPTHPIAIAMAELHQRVGFRPQDLWDMLASMRMDAEGKMQAPSSETLERYCYGAASCVGLLSMRVFGCEGETADRFAYVLGQALQLTNILRDRKVDAEKNRDYLPHGQSPQDLTAKAHGYFAEAEKLAEYLPTRSIAPALAMRDVYRFYLDWLEKHDFQAPIDGKIHLNWLKKWQLGWRAAGYFTA